jgi:hypothetical protein
MDGMGTSNRSKAFHDVSWKNLGDAGFPDRILWHEATAAEHRDYDIRNMGIYGNSAGGQNSLGALLFHPDFYKVSVSTSGCHDNRMDKIWWNELWMSWPLGPHYDASSNVVNAHRLQGKLGEFNRSSQHLMEVWRWNRGDADAQTERCASRCTHPADPRSDAESIESSSGKVSLVA